MDSNKLLNESINKLIISIDINNKHDDLSGIINSSNELLETLRLVENCSECKRKLVENYHTHFLTLDETINELIDLSKRIGEFDFIHQNLIKSDNKLNAILCDGCKEKKDENLTNKCGSGEIAKFLYECKKNGEDNDYIKWIPYKVF